MLQVQVGDDIDVVAVVTTIQVPAPDGVFAAAHPRLQAFAPGAGTIGFPSPSTPGGYAPQTIAAPFRVTDQPPVPRCRALGVGEHKVQVAITQNQPDSTVARLDGVAMVKVVAADGGGGNGGGNGTPERTIPKIHTLSVELRAAG